jgi:hypothetical protein
MAAKIMLLTTSLYMLSTLKGGIEVVVGISSLNYC